MMECPRHVDFSFWIRAEHHGESKQVVVGFCSETVAAGRGTKPGCSVKNLFRVVPPALLPQDGTFAEQGTDQLTSVPISIASGDSDGVLEPGLRAIRPTGYPG